MLAFVLSFVALAISVLALIAVSWQQSIDPRFEMLIAKEIARQLNERHRVRRVEPVKQGAS